MGVDDCVAVNARVKPLSFFSSSLSLSQCSLARAVYKGASAIRREPQIFGAISTGARVYWYSLLAVQTRGGERCIECRTRAVYKALARARVSFCAAKRGVVIYSAVHTPALCSFSLVSIHARNLLIPDEPTRELRLIDEYFSLGTLRTFFRVL